MKVDAQNGNFICILCYENQSSPTCVWVRLFFCRKTKVMYINIKINETIKAIDN
jgi:hypothetical protein